MAKLLGSNEYTGVHDFLTQVSVGGRFIKYGFTHDQLADNLTAFAGGGQGNATVVSFAVSIFTTVASSGDSARLRDASSVALAGTRVTIINLGANAMDLFPASGGKIDNLSVDTAVSIPAGGSRELISRNTLDWATIKD